MCDISLQILYMAHVLGIRTCCKTGGGWNRLILCDDPYNNITFAFSFQEG